MGFNLAFKGLNRPGRQFSRLLAAMVRASAVVMVECRIYIPSLCEKKGYWLPTSFASFPFTSPPVRHRVPSRFNWTLSGNSSHHHLQSSLFVRRMTVCYTIYGLVRHDNAVVGLFRAAKHKVSRTAQLDSQIRHIYISFK
jgi:hypothetical protein